MLHHLVLFDLDPAADDEAVDAAVQALRDLADEIDEVVSLSVGRDVGLAAGNAGLGLHVVTADAHGWRAYQEHPRHVAAANDRVRPVITGRTAVQFED